MAIDKETRRQELAQTVQELMTPIDFEALRAEGILGKRQGAWHEVLDMARLPEYVRKRINEMVTHSGEKPPTVKFLKVTKRLERLQKLLNG